MVKMNFFLYLYLFYLSLSLSLSLSLLFIYLLFLFPDGAHHLDLRASDPQDPASVINARKQELAYIDKWIREAEKQKRGL
jgi:hypothetical protein